MDRFFKLKQNGTTVGREVIAGLTTFFAMAYIIAVNPTLLSASPVWNGAPSFLATIISAIIGTLIMGLVANVPYAQAPGMGLNAFFVYTVCFALGFTWQQALSMVFICGIINIHHHGYQKSVNTSSRLFPAAFRTPSAAASAFLSPISGLLNIDIIGFTGAAISERWSFNTYVRHSSRACQVGFPVTLALPDRPGADRSFCSSARYKGAILIGIVATALIGIPMEVTGYDGYHQLCGSLHSNCPRPSALSSPARGWAHCSRTCPKIPLVLVTIFAFSVSDTFDTIGTFIGTGRRTGIFSDEDEHAMETTRRLQIQNG